MLARPATWRYPRAATTFAVLAVSVLGTLLAWAVLPPTWRPGAGWMLPAAAAAYAALRLDAYAQVGKRVKHAVLDPLGGDVDDAQTWLVAALAGGGLLVLVQVVRRVLGA